MIANVKPYPEMKASGVPWLGEVPKHWDVLPNRAVFTEVNERDYANADVLSVTIQKGVIPQRALLADVSRRDTSRQDKSDYKLVQPGDIAYNKMRAWQGAIGVSRYRGIVSPAYVIQRPHQNADARYLHYLLRTPSFAKEAERWSYGITSDMWSLRPEHFRMICSCLPPVAEQAAIVRFLDYADRRIRRYIRAKQKLIKVLEEQKQAIIHRAVTRGVDPNVRLKPSGVECLGDVPEHWEVRRAKTVCLNIVDCKNRTPDPVDGGHYLVVRTTCVRDGRFDPAGGYLTNEENFRIWTARGAPRLGDVFFTREAPAGEACLVPDRSDLCMGQRMMYFRPDPGALDPEYLLLNVYGPLTRIYIDLATNGSTVGHLRLGQVYALPLLWCPIEEQRAIVRHVRTATSGLDRAQDYAKCEVGLLREYRTRLIADVVTGKLDVREAAAHLSDEFDEPEPLEEVEVDADEDAEQVRDEVLDEAEA